MAGTSRGCSTTTTDDGPPLIDFYDGRARELLERATSLLDLGTGGGEHLANLGPFPPVAVATESYLPNVSVAADRFAPLGIHVVQRIRIRTAATARSRAIAGRSGAYHW